MSEETAGERRGTGRRLVYVGGVAVLLLAVWVLGRGLTSLHASWPLDGLLGSVSEAGRLGEGAHPAASPSAGDRRFAEGSAEGRPRGEAPRAEPERPRPGGHAPLPGGAEPRSLTLEGLGLRAEVEPAAQGRVLPTGERAVGWYREGPVPGASGTAMLLGRTELDGGPGVFAHLAEVRPGARVGVGRPDGSVAQFTVVKRQAVECGSLVEGAAEGGPQEYGPAASRPAGGPRDPLAGEQPRGGAHRAELRLLGCTSSGGVGADVMVSAHLTGVRKG